MYVCISRGILYVGNLGSPPDASKISETLVDIEAGKDRVEVLCYYISVRNDEVR